MENSITVKLKEQYRNIGGDDDDRRQFHSRTVVGLELVVKNKGEHFLARVKNEQRHTIVSHGEIFKQLKKGEQPIRKVLVEGGAGMGKSTLCTSLTKDWANGKLFQDYDVLLFVPLGQREVASATSLLQLIEALKLKVNSQEIVSYIQGKNGGGVVVIADGWNSLNESERREGSFFHKLLFGSLVSLASVVVTSRPTVSAALHKGDSVDRFIETCGFNRESIQDYVKHELAGDRHDSANADGLLKQIDGNPVLLRMCSVPITCTKVCQLWQTSEGAFPSRITELCTKIVLNILNYKHHEMGILRSISSMTDIDKLPKHIQESWWRLCKLAYLTIKESKVDLTMFDSFQYGIMTFGFVEYSNTDEGRLSVSVNFVHPTSHEYLAALHIVRQPADKQLKNLNDISLACRQAPILWKYFFGLICDYISLDTLNDALQMISTYHPPKCRLLCSCAFEAQNDAITSEVIKCLSTQIKTNTIVQLSGAHNSHDCDAMLYVIENIKPDSKCDGLHIDFSECSFRSEQICRLTTILASNAAKPQVKELDLSGNNLADKQVAHLFKTAASSFRSLETLLVRNNKIHKEGIIAIKEALPELPSPSLKHLDVSFNDLELSGVKCLCDAVMSGKLANLNTLLMQQCLKLNAENNTKFLKMFLKIVLSHCPHLRQLNMYGNAFVPSKVTEIITELGDKDIHLIVTLDDKTLVEFFKDTMKRNKLINHTVVHGVFVGPGRSGKNSLMNRLIGEGPADPNRSIPSTGVLENVIKVQVKKFCRVGASEKKRLHWNKLKYECEDIELMMATLRNKARREEPTAEFVDTVTEEVKTPHKEALSSAPATVTVFSTSKCPTLVDDTNTTENPSNRANNESNVVQVTEGYVVNEEQGSNSHDDPVDMVSRAAKFQCMNALCERLESSWMLYLTNTGGQTEFQELLPVLMCGPSVFFITFSLNKELNNGYDVCYEGSCESENYSYPSSSTLIEEILQTLATINALERSRTVALKVFFVGTHKDKLEPKLLECCIDDQTKVIDKWPRECKIDDRISVNLKETVDKRLREYGFINGDQTIKIISVDDQNLIKEFDKQREECKVNNQTKIIKVDGQVKIIIIISVDDQIKTIDKQLRDKVKRTSLQDSIVYAVKTKQLIFTVNNYDQKHTDFYHIQLRLQEEVEKCDKFTVECPLSWFIFSLLLRHKSDSEQWLRYYRCVKLAKDCCIGESDLHEALSFIHRKLGLVRYFRNTQLKEFNGRVIIDPRILFEFITQIINKKIVKNHDEEELQDLYTRGVISKELIDNEKHGKWFITLLIHLELVAVFKKDRNTFYFFPFLLCRAPPLPQCPTASRVNELHTPPLLIGFNSGFCPRVIPGALMTYLMSSDVKWEFRSKQVYRNQVSFEVEEGVIILKSFCTHLEVKLGDNSEMTNFTKKKEEQTCKEAYRTLKKAMNYIVTKVYRLPESENDSFFYFGFYCTHSNCKDSPHCTKIVYLKDKKMKLRCYNIDEHTGLPPNYHRWIPGPERQTVKPRGGAEWIITVNLEDYSQTGTDFSDVDILNYTEVMEEISSLTAKYYPLGVELGVPPGELDKLKIQYAACNIDQAFTDMVLLWLRGKSTRTWQALVTAVDKFDHGLAMTIAGRHRVDTVSSVAHSSPKPPQAEHDPSIITPIATPRVEVERRLYLHQQEENNREIEAMEVNFKYHQDTTESNFNLEWGAAFGQKDTSDDGSLAQVQDECVEDEQELNSKLTETSDHEPGVENDNRVMGTRSDYVMEDSPTTLLQKPSQLCQTESTFNLDLEATIQVENKQERNGSLLETDISHNVTVDSFKAESKNTIDLDVVETKVEQVVKEQEETREDMRPVNDSLPSSRGITTPGLATQIEEEHSTDSIQSQTSVTSLHHLDSSTSTQVASKQSTNPKENSDINEDPFKAESKNTIEVEELVKEQEETRGNVRPVNDSLPSSRGTTTPGLATQIEEEHSADSIQSQTSVTSLHHLDSSTSTQVASKQSTNPKENSDISEGAPLRMSGEVSALERVLTSVPEPLRWKLDQQIDFENDDGRGRIVPRHIGRIATVMTGWESTIADELGLTDAEKHDILEQNIHNPQLQRREALSRWKARLGRRASYRALVEVFIRADHEDYAEVVCGLLTKGSSTTTGVAVEATGHNRMGGGSLTQTATDTLVPTATAGRPPCNFSPTMGPTQLCQWLLQECGYDYQEDIDKVKAGGINGELFLEFAEDKTLLQDLKVSPGFQRLLIKRAQQVNVQLSLISRSTSSLGEASLVTGSYYTMSEPYSTMSEGSLPIGAHSTMSEASLPIRPYYASTTISFPERSSSLHFPVCTTVDSDEEEDKQSGDFADGGVIEMPPDDVQAAWAHRNVIWRGRKELGVKFLNDIPPNWTFDGSKLNKANIMIWANEWSLRGDGVIPKFVRIEDPSAESDIRVLFTKGKTLSKIGNKAKRVESDQPTMWLNLRSGGIDDSFKKHLVVHEFGHALGLGHEHQRSDFWKILKPYLNKEEMKLELSIRFGVDGEDFERDWGREKKSIKGKATAYDSESVMHYWFKKSWLKAPYHNRSKIVEDSQPGGCLSQEVAQVLLGVHDRDAENNSPPKSPSNQDIQLLKELYGSENTCTIIMEPPPVGGSEFRKTNTQDPKKVTMFLLSNLKSKSGERINIINKVSPRWSEFAVQLDFDNDGTTMQMIRERCYPDPEDCCKEMMREWLSGKGRQPVTWELLVEILKDCELEVLAKQVEEAVCTYPTMFLLSNFKSKSGERINIINRVSPHWSEFAVQLDFDNDGTTMQTIDKVCGPDPEACCKEMMREWLSGKGRQPVTWELLVEILKDCELGVLAKQVEEAVCFLPPANV